LEALRVFAFRTGAVKNSRALRAIASPASVIEDGIVGKTHPGRLVGGAG
jgi:hypothetical protein